MNALRRFFALFRRSRLDREMAEEMAAHIERETEQNLARGLAPDEARCAARRAFGGLDQLQERERDARGFRWLEDGLRDVRFAVRQLTASPGFTAVTVLTLALGVGVATAMFSALYGILLRPLPFPDADRLVTVRSYNEQQGGQIFPYAFNVSWSDYADWAARNHSFEHLAAYDLEQAALLGGDTPRQLTAFGVTSDYFSVFSRPVALGRAFTAEESAAADGSRVILSHAFWTEAFNRNPAIIGQTLRLDSGPCTVVGVAAPEIDFRRDVRPQIFRPLATRWIANHRDWRMLWVFGRLKAGVILAQARDDLDGISRQLKVEHPDTNRTWSTRIWSLQDVLTRTVRRPLVLLYAAAAAALLLACVNIATLLLVRATARQQEMAVRAALGASRSRLIRQLLTESLLLALAGGAFGVLISLGGLNLTANLARQLGVGGVTGATDITFSGPVLGFALVGTAAACVAFGLYPAIHLARTPLEAALRAGGRSLTATLSRQRVLRTLVVTQIALAFVLAVGAGLLTRSLWRLQQASPGFRATGLLAAELTRPNSTYRQSNEQRAAFATAVIARLSALPGVTGAAAVNYLPFTGYNMSMGFTVANHPATPGVFTAAELRTISPSYFRVMGMPVLRGRGFADSDTGNHPVVIVDEIFVRQFFGTEDPIGQSLIIAGTPTEIVGIAGKMKDRGPGETDVLAHYYVPLAQFCQADLAFVVRTGLEPATLADAVRRAVATVDAQQPVRHLAVLQELQDNTIAPNRLSAALISVFAGFGLLLSTLGIYGVIAFAVAQRTRELAIRMAFGAPRGAVFRSVLVRGAALAGIGVGLGAIGSVALQRVFESFLFALSPFDAASFAAAFGMLLGIALLACWLPAWRATRADPIMALRAE